MHIKLIDKYFAMTVLMLAVSTQAAADDLMSSASITKVDSQYNNSNYAASNLIDGNNASIWLSGKQTNDINFLLNEDSTPACFESLDFVGYNSSSRSVRQFMLLSSIDTALSTNTDVTGWRPVIADPNPTGLVDYLSWAQGARLVSIDSQYNSSDWAAKNLNDGGTDSQWLSYKSNNVIEYNFDTDWSGIAGDGIPINEIEILNYGSSRSVKEFQIEVTADGTNWSKLEVPTSVAGDGEYIYSQRQEGGILGAIDSQYNTSSWGAKNMQDGDQNTRWLSRKGNNSIEFSFDPNHNGTTGENGDAGDLFSMEKFTLSNYGVSGRSVREFQVAVKTLAEPIWQRIRKPGASVGEEDYDFLLSHHGGKLDVVDSQYNTSSWAAKNIHDGDQNTLWLSGKGNNTFEFSFDANEDGVTGAAGDSADLFTFKQFYLQNYGESGRAIKQFQVAVKTLANTNWVKLPVPGGAIGEADYNFALVHQGGVLAAIDTQYNTSSWAAKNIHDGDANTLWLSSKGNNTLDLQFDVDGDGTTGGAGDLFSMQSFYLQNYGVSGRSVRQFQLEVKTTANINWTKLAVPGTTANTPNYNFALSAHGGQLTSIDSQYNSSSWGAKNLHDGDQNTLWLSSKPDNTLTFAFDTDNNGSSGDGINLDTVSLTNYGVSGRSIQTFEIDIQISAGAWQIVNAPLGGTIFTANKDSNGQSWAVGAFSNVTAVRIRTLNNYGDPSYTGAAEFAFSGQSLGPSYTFIAAKHGNGETFTLDTPLNNVTDVRLRTINNHGDNSYIGAAEFKVLGPSVSKTVTFTAAKHGDGETFELDAEDVPVDVIGVKLITVNNHGDPNYIGAKEFKIQGPSVTESKTFVAANNGSGETFQLDVDDIPSDVTAVKLITINNYGDPSYIGVQEFSVVGPSVTASHTFTLPSSKGPHRIVLDPEDTVTDIVGVRLVTIKNHGDPNYIAMTEVKLFGVAIGPSYIFEAANNNSSQNFAFEATNASLFRFHSLNNYGDPNYTVATEMMLNSGVCKFANWRFDEAFWTGTNDEVLDSSGIGYHGSALGFDSGSGDPNTTDTAPAASGDPGTCRYGEFDGEDDYIEIANSSELDDIPQLTLSAWFKAKSFNQSNASLERGLLSKGLQGNNVSYGAFFSNTSGNKLLVDIDGKNDRFSSNTVFSPDTWYHIAIVYDGSRDAAQRVQLYVDGVLDGTFAESSDTIPHNSGNFFIGNIINSPDKLKVFDGAIDEVNMMARAVSASEVVFLMNQTRPCASPLFLNINTNGASASTCQAKPITIQACQDAACTSLISDYAGTVDISVSSGNGDWSINNANGTLTDTTADDGLATYEFDSINDGGAISLNLSDTHAETITITVTDAAAGESVVSSSVEFTDNAFVIDHGDNMHIAGRDQAMSAALYTRDGSVCAINPLYNGTKNLQLWLDKDLVDPNGAPPQINLTDLPDSDSTDFELNFVNGLANFILATSDVGKYKINILDDSFEFSDQPIIGISDAIITRPFGFNLQIGSALGEANPAASDSDGEVFMPAGADFTTTVTAVTWQASDDLDDNGIPDGHDNNDPADNADLTDNNPTISFGLENNGAAESVTLIGNEVLPTLVTTFNALNGSAPSCANCTASAFSAGAGVSGNLYYDNVGIIEIKATLADGSYLGGEDVLGSSGYVGRFTPDHFDLAISEDGLLGSSIDSLVNGFVYTGQMDASNTDEGEIRYEVAPKFSITAKSARGTTTTNYNTSGGFLKLDANSITQLTPSTDTSQLGKDNINKLGLTANLTAPIFSEENDGVFSYQFSSSDNFVYTRDANSLIDKFFADIDLTIVSVIDGDDIEAVDEDNQVDNGVLTLNPTGLEIRFGRLFLHNSYGPETENLPLAMHVQYFNGSTFVINQLENTLEFDATNSTITNIDLSPGVTTASGNGYFVFGQADGLLLSSPNPHRGSVKVEYTAPEWLLYDWQNTDGNSDGPYDEEPSSKVTFGRFRGNDRIIQWREVFN